MQQVKDYVPRRPTYFFSLSGFKAFLFLADMLPAVLNKLSKGKLEAQTDKYFLARCVKAREKM